MHCLNKFTQKFNINKFNDIVLYIMYICENGFSPIILNSTTAISIYESRIYLENEKN